ncbi:MAG TPA: hypothetical protein VHG92_10065 [Afifellaceae bacterium]|nr:hypothetical protein [Afifellaceae bacterium]
MKCASLAIAEDVGYFLQRRLVAAAERDRLAVRHLGAGARQRDVEEVDAVAARPAGKRRDARRVAGAGDEHDLPVRRRSRLRHAAWSQQHRLDLVGIEDGDQYSVAGSRHVGGRGRPAAAHRLQPGAGRGVDVAADHREAGAQEALRQRGADQAEAYETDRAAVIHP